MAVVMHEGVVVFNASFLKDMHSLRRCGPGWGSPTPRFVAREGRDCLDGSAKDVKFLLSIEEGDISVSVAVKAAETVRWAEK